MGIVTDYLIGLIRRQVDEKGIVVWFDPTGLYSDLVSRLELPDTQIARFSGSYLELRRAVDAQMNDVRSETPPRLLIYVQHNRAQTGHTLDEFIFAGIVTQPGEAIPRNTSLDVLARQALRAHFARERLDEIADEIRKGRVTTLDELDRLAEQGDSGALGLIFGSGQSGEIAQKFLVDTGYDAELAARDAVDTLGGVLNEEYGATFPEGDGPETLRTRFRKHLLIADFLLHLKGEPPAGLKNIHLPETRLQRENCLQLVDLWRKRRDLQASYAEAARQIEREFNLEYEELEWEALQDVETFPEIETRLQSSVENALAAQPNQELVDLANRRRSGFWGESDERAGARWALIGTAGSLLLKAGAILDSLRRSPPADVGGFIQKYTSEPELWCRLDTLHRNLERLGQALDFDPSGGQLSLEKLLARARQEYSQVVDVLAQRFVTALSKTGFSIGNILYQTEVFSRQVSPYLGKTKLAYVLVDALRYEMALDLAGSLDRDWKTEITPALATPPTITPIGMAALLPGAERGISLAQIGELAAEIGGKILKTRKDRVAYLASKLDGMYETKLEMLVPAKKSTREALQAAKFILVTSQEIDLLGEGESIAQAREFMDSALAKLARAFRVLIDHGVERIVVAADHGYIFADELDADLTIPAPGGQTVDLHRRVWVGRGGQVLEGVLRIPAQALNLGSDFELATPAGLACFAAPGGRAFFHGGLSLQELIIPVLVLEPVKVGQLTTLEWSLTPGRDKITTRFFSVQIEGHVAAKSMFESAPPLVRVEIRATGKAVSTPVSATYGLQEATGEVQMRWKADSTFELEPNTVALMLTGDVGQRQASILLIDAENEKTLKKLEIDVAISI